jgi:hypothetical protein
MTVDAKAKCYDSVIFTRALVRGTLFVGTGAFFSFVVAEAARHNCFYVFLLVIT